jgi:GR25 family glycosyltransferase involved in LPS biosynthesis
MTDIPIFVISLSRSTDRREKFHRYNAEYLPNYAYIEAVDGNKIDLEQLPDYLFTKEMTKYYTKGAIGCALSHGILWEKCIELDRPIIVMEDDLIVSKDFSNHLQAVMEMLPLDNWDILQLSYNLDTILSYKNTNYSDCHCIFDDNNITDTMVNDFRSSTIHPTIARLNYCFGTSCYLLHPRGAKLLSKNCFPLNNRVIANVPFLNTVTSHTIDCMMNGLYKNISAFVCIIPFTMTPHNSEQYVSTIQ